MNRQFADVGPNRLWVSDITERRTAGGKVNLGVMLDAGSRRVIGWSIADHIRAELVVDALQVASGVAGPRGPTAPSATPTTDRNTQDSCHQLALAVFELDRGLAQPSPPGHQHRRPQPHRRRGSPHPPAALAA